VVAVCAAENKLIVARSGGVAAIVDAMAAHASAADLIAAACHCLLVVAASRGAHSVVMSHPM
jgi:hypothetical protein